MGWNNNLDEAPKDGTEILAAYFSDALGSVRGDYSIVRWDNGRWVAQADGQPAIEAQSDFRTDYIEPFCTHWMPLPEPPRNLEASQ